MKYFERIKRKKLITMVKSNNFDLNLFNHFFYSSTNFKLFEIITHSAILNENKKTLEHILKLQNIKNNILFFESKNVEIIFKFNKFKSFSTFIHNLQYLPDCRKIIIHNIIMKNIFSKDKKWIDLYLKTKTYSKYIKKNKHIFPSLINFDLNIDFYNLLNFIKKENIDLTYEILTHASKTKCDKITLAYLKLYFKTNNKLFNDTLHSIIEFKMQKSWYYLMKNDHKFSSHLHYQALGHISLNFPDSLFQEYFNFICVDKYRVLYKNHVPQYYMNKNILEF